MSGHVHLLSSDKTLGATLQRQLEAKYFFVTQSQETDSGSAIPVLKAEQPEVIALVRGPETHLPDLRRLKQAFPNRSLMVIDPIPSPSAGSSAFEHGCNAYLALPQPLDMLHLRVQAQIRQARRMEDASSTDDVLRLLGFDPSIMAMPDDTLDRVRLDVRHEDPAYAALLADCLAETGFSSTIMPLEATNQRISKDGLVIGALTAEGWKSVLTLVARERGRTATRDLPIVIASPFMTEAVRRDFQIADVQDFWLGQRPDQMMGVLVRELVRGTKQSVQRRRALVQSLDLAITDGLTGLFNQRYLTAHLPLQMQVARQAERPLSFALLDLDGFKGLNDSFGHQAGDQFLIGVADFLRKNSRTSDSAVRLGGDEFALVLPSVDAETAKTVVQRLVDDISTIRHAGSDQGTIKITASAGLVTMNPEDWTSTADAIIAVADARLYAAKEKGGNQILDAAL